MDHESAVLPEITMSQKHAVSIFHENSYEKSERSKYRDSMVMMVLVGSDRNTVASGLNTNKP